MSPFSPTPKKEILHLSPDAIVGAMVYGFGFYASSSMQSEMAMAFLVLHISFQCFNIPLSICATGMHSLSPRASDPQLDMYCCDLESGEARLPN